MYISEKIKDVLKEIIDGDEYSRIINCPYYTSKERKLAKRYLDGLKGMKDIKKIPIKTLLLTMPRVVMLDVVSYLIPYKVDDDKQEEISNEIEVELK